MTGTRTRSVPPIRRCWRRRSASAFDRIVASFPDREALVVPFQGIRLTYRELAEQRRSARTRACSRSVSRKAIGWGCGVRTTPSGSTSSSPRRRPASMLVNINPAYQTEELRYALAQSGCRASGVGDRIQVQRLRGDDLRGPRVVAGSRARRACSIRRIGMRCWPAAMALIRCRVGRPWRVADQPRSDQHPVHQWHDRLPEGRHAQPSQPAEQRLLPRPRVPLHRGRSGVHPGAVLPLLRDGHRQPGQPHARDDHGAAGPSFDPLATLQTMEAERCTSVLGVPTMFIAMLVHPEFHDRSICRRCEPA